MATPDQTPFRFVRRYSRRDQVFVPVTVSLPFYVLALDLPKTIVNKAVRGGSGSPSTASEISTSTVQWITSARQSPRVPGRIVSIRCSGRRTGGFPTPLSLTVPPERTILPG